MFSIQLIYKVHLKPVDGQDFVVFKVVQVLHLSEWPKLEDNFFGDLGLGRAFLLSPLFDKLVDNDDTVFESSSCGWLLFKLMILQE